MRRSSRPEPTRATPCPAENPMVDVLFHTPGPNGVSFVETMTEDERNWVKACGCDDVFGEDGVAKSEPEILKSRERLEEEAYILGLV